MIDDSHRVTETLKSGKTRRSAKRLEDFETFLHHKFTKRRESSAQKKGKENILHLNASNDPASKGLKQEELLGSLMLQSEAF